MREAVGKVRIVSDDDSAGCVGVEPSGTEDSPGTIDKVNGFFSARRVKVGTDDTFWFVQEEINLFGGTDFFALDGYNVGLRVGEGG